MEKLIVLEPTTFKEFQNVLENRYCSIKGDFKK